MPPFLAAIADAAEANELAGQARIHLYLNNGRHIEGKLANAVAYLQALRTILGAKAVARMEADAAPTDRVYLEDAKDGKDSLGWLVCEVRDVTTFTLETPPSRTAKGFTVERRP